MQEFVPLFENLVNSSPLWVPVLATAYVLLTAAFSIFGDQLGWLWRVSISAPIGTAAIAVLLLSRERLGSSLAIFGVALIGYGVALIVDNRLAVGVALICAGVALIGGEIALIVDNRLAVGVALIGLGGSTNRRWGRTDRRQPPGRWGRNYRSWSRKHRL